MAERSTRKIIAKSGGASARANGGGAARKIVTKAGGGTAQAKSGGTVRVNYRDGMQTSKVSDATERRRVVKRAAGRVRTKAKVDSVTME